MMFDTYQQQRDWQTLMTEIEEAPETISCTSFPDLFFLTGNENSANREAKKLCNTCPVIKECAVYALKWEREGIWGGLSAKERNQMRSKHLRRTTLTNL
jgi:hypothetical protein